ncbi:complement C1q tumor necrosis factor-related protein 3-like [Dreissena polymorpha]|uniref:C1q domain-containing protein n=1 Tax=Dreissena polymorpha TaxID=45954 RepID=A0A9D4J3M4_DREPO|nr:complement C1q tumor necrosis factor-related protein 3-like [Dreissena polymorpha]KAH3798561.1 hypothetical protein DPMN_152161 [Dreissena polymorpha]
MRNLASVIVASCLFINYVCFCVSCESYNSEQLTNELLQEVKMLRDDVKKSLEHIDILDRERIAHKEQIQTLEKRCSGFDDLLSSLKQENARLERWLAENQGHTNAARSSRFIVDPTSQIAFTAFLSGQPIEINENDRVPYNAVELNLGNGYDVTKHEFTCPANGVYVFHSSLYTRGLDHSVIQMLKDGVLLTTMSTRGDNTGEGYDQGTELVLTICNKNQKIWTIAATQYHTGEVDASAKATSLSGFLLFEL